MLRESTKEILQKEAPYANCVLKNTQGTQRRRGT
jgi:hypothetical protein